MGPMPVRTDGPFVHYESTAGASSSSMAAEFSDQPTSAKRRRQNPPTLPSERAGPSQAATAARSDQEALIIAALVSESGMLTWVTEVLWDRYNGDVGQIRSGFQDIREQLLSIAEADGVSIDLVQALWSQFRGDLVRVREQIRQFKGGNFMGQ